MAEARGEGDTVAHAFLWHKGAKPVSEIAKELTSLEEAMADPDQADRMDAIIERYGEVQARFEPQHLSGF